VKLRSIHYEPNVGWVRKKWVETTLARFYIASDFSGERPALTSMRGKVKYKSLACSCFFYEEMFGSLVM